MTKDFNNENKHWQELRDENYDNTFPRVEAWVNNLNSEKSQNFKPNKIQSMKNYFAVHKFKLVYSFILVAVVFAACNVPVTQNETLGHALTWKVIKNNNYAVSKVGTLAWVDKSKLSVQELSDGDKPLLSYSLILDAKSNDELHDYMKQLRDIDGIASVQLYPLNQTTKLPLYAAALHSFFRIDVDATNKSDEQVREELQRQLKEAGVDDITVDFKTDAKGNRMLEIEPTEVGLNRKEGAPNNKDFELSVKDGDNEQFLKTRHKSAEMGSFEGKSDEEIRRMVTEDMNKNGMNVKPEDLVIMRDEKGRVQVEFKHTENTKDKTTQTKIELKMK
jgi:hypothetical protein